MKAYLGVDWSAKELKAAVVGERGEPKRLKGARPTLASVRDLVARAKEMVEASEVHVLIESGAPQWVQLLQAAGAVVYVADGKQAKSYAQSLSSSGAKDDRRDARNLALMCRSEAHRGDPWEPLSVKGQRIELLGGLHERGTTDLVRCKQRLRDMIRKQMPHVEAALPKDLLMDWVDVFLRAVSTPWHAKGLSRDDLRRLMPRTRKETQDRVWTALQETEAPWLDEEIAADTAFAVGQELDQMKLLAAQLEEIDQKLHEATRDLPARQIMETMGGIGLHTSTVILQHGFRGEVPSNRDQASIRMGSSPVFMGSGQHYDGTPKGAVKMRRAAPSRARKTTYVIGRLATQNLRWAKAMYTDALAHGQKPATVYRRIARAVLRIQTAMVRDGKPYDEDGYIRTLQQKGVRWAMAL